MKHAIAVALLLFALVAVCPAQTATPAMTPEQINAVLAANDGQVKQLSADLDAIKAGIEASAQAAIDAASTDWPIFVTANVGFSRYTSPKIQGGSGVGIRITQNFYALTELNLAGGEGAVTEDALYRVACRAYLCVWGRLGMGAQTATTEGSTVTTATFGGGGMLTYDIGARWSKLAGLIGGVSLKAMHLTENGVPVTRPQFQANVIFTFPKKQ